MSGILPGTTTTGCTCLACTLILPSLHERVSLVPVRACTQGLTFSDPKHLVAEAVEEQLEMLRGRRAAEARAAAARGSKAAKRLDEATPFVVYHTMPRVFTAAEVRNRKHVAATRGGGAAAAKGGGGAAITQRLVAPTTVHRCKS